MTLPDRIAAYSRRPSATVTIGGKRWAGILRLSRDQSFGSGVSGGEVVGRDPPVSITEGETPISWTWGYDGLEVAGFSGVVTRVTQRSYPNQWRLQVADPLWFANIRRGDIATSPLNNIAASTAVAQILGAAGISRMSIPTLAASGSAWAGGEWKLGQLTPVAWTNTVALQAAQDICGALGYWLYADASGVVRATLMERRPSSSPFRTLRWGVDFLLAGTPDRERDAATVCNRVVVRGANTGVGGAQISDTWQTGAADRTREFSSFLVEYVNEAEAGAASCTGIAKRILLLWSRQPNVIRIGRIKADPRFAVGQTVAVVCDLIGLSSATPFFVYGLNTSLDLVQGEFVQQMVLDGGTGTQGYTTVPPPVASFTWSIIRETFDGTGVVELYLDGTGSVSNTEGEIVSYAWSTSTTTALGTPTTAAGPKAMFVYPAATITATVTLTVTDTTSKTASITQTIALAGDDLVTPTSDVISLALGAAWAVSPDGGATWHVEATGDSTMVPDFGGESLLSTRATGSTGIRGTRNALATASDTLASLGAQVTALAQTIDSPERVWAGVGTSLYLSTDEGVTFTLWGTLPATVLGVIEDPALLYSVFVLAGANMYQATSSTPPGSAWSVLFAGPTGATARQLVRGASGATTWIAYTGTFTGSPLQRVEGPIGALFDPPVSEIRAIALSPDELTVYAWDADGVGWSVDSATGVATATGADLGAGETAMHANHSPSGPAVFVATFGAAEGTTYKYLPAAGGLFAPFYVPASGQQSHRVGFGAGIPIDADLILAPSGAGGAADKIWYRSAGAWAGLTPPHSGWYWTEIAANPSNRAEWLLLGSQGGEGDYHFVQSGGAIVSRTGHGPVLYRTTDSGATWAAVTLTLPGGTPAGTPAFLRLLGFGSAGASDWALIYNVESALGVQVSGLIAGSDGTAAGGFYGGGTVRNMSYGADGLGGDWLSQSDPVSGTGSGHSYFWRTAAGASSFGAVGGARNNYGQTDRRMERLPGVSPIVFELVDGGSSSGLLTRALDYRSAAPASTGLVVDGIYLTAANHGLYIGGRGDGVLRIADPTALSLSGTVVALAGQSVGLVRSDRQTRTAVAALQTSSVAVTRDGLKWRTLALPDTFDVGAMEVLG